MIYYYNVLHFSTMLFGDEFLAQGLHLKLVAHNSLEYHYMLKH